MEEQLLRSDGWRYVNTVSISAARRSLLLHPFRTSYETADKVRNELLPVTPVSGAAREVNDAGKLEAGARRCQAMTWGLFGSLLFH